MSEVELSIVIPAYNEAARLPDGLRRVIDYVHEQGLNAEVIVVDDGSTDGTGDAVKAMLDGDAAVRLLHHEANQGKGGAVRTGVAASAGRVVLFSDADLSTPIEDYPLLRARLERGADVAIGSRALDRRLVEVHQPWYRELMGRVFNLAVQVILLPGLWDTQCGFKAFRGVVARELFSDLQTAGFEFDVEILYRARRAGYRVDEVPVHWRDRPGSRVDPVRDSREMLRGLFRIRRIVG